MKTKIHALLCAAVLVASGAGLLSAQVPPAPPVEGRVLMLDNERVLEGEITREGDVYVIKRPVGELRVPTAKALTVCASMEEAFKILSTRTNLRDPDERVRLARWCQMHGLTEQAISQTKSALVLQPGHPDATHLLVVLQRTPSPSQQPTGEKELAAVPPDTPPLLDVSSNGLVLFTTKIQPILMNTCASCHASGRAGNFLLTRSTDAAGCHATQTNLSAVLQQISFDRPSASPLLLKACSGHGGSLQPPLGTSQAKPLETLKNWVEQVAMHSSNLRSHGAPFVTTVDPRPADETMGSRVVSQQQPTPPNGPGPAVSQDAPMARSVPSYAAETPAAAQPPALRQTPAPSAANPYDPAVFNALFHPNQ
jgi:hypothetical protein